jgi:hypothetical protein
VARASVTLSWGVHSAALTGNYSGTRAALQPMVVAGMREPLLIGLDFDAPTIDAMLERLAILRSQMLPPIRSN